jgi:phosphatidate cytidylyltransferase
MFSQRIIVAIILIPVTIGAVYAGGWVYLVLILGLLGTAAWEYLRMFQKGGLCPSRSILIGGVLLLAASRAWLGFTYSDLFLSAIILVCMFVHTLAYERGIDCSASSFAVTLSGVLYLGWIGAYLFSLRNLPDGIWWTLTVVPSAAFADSGGYIFGKTLGKHRFSPRVSPKKTWEGYLGGIVFAMVLTALIAALWHLRAPAITPLAGLIIGAVMSILCPIGDLGESMLKRQFGLKDSSNLLPGHGGIFDRIDSWLWAGVIGYYLVLLLTGKLI